MTEIDISTTKPAQSGSSPPLIGGEAPLNISMGTKIGLLEEIRFRNLVEQNINQLVAWVNKDMQCELDLSGVQFKLISGSELGKMRLQDWREKTGNDRTESRIGMLLERFRAISDTNYMCGSWDQGRRTVFIVRESFNDANDKRALSTLYHELVHAAQDQKYPEFKNDSFALWCCSTPQERRDTIFARNARTAWIEGQATFLQWGTGRGKERFEGAHLERGVGSKVIDLLDRVLFGKPNRSGYGARWEVALLFKALYSQADGQAIIDDAYQNPHKITKIVEDFFEREFPLGGAPFTRHPD